MNFTRTVVQALNSKLYLFKNQMHTDTFRASDLVITKANTFKAKPPEDKLVFGASFTDHMFSVDWNKDSGWSSPEIKELKNLSLHPATSVFHYASECFEGMKAYRDPAGNIRLFRPEKNMERFCRSTSRLCFPAFDKDELLKCLMKLIEIEQDWVPSLKSTSLYIRPFMISTEQTIGLKPPGSAKIMIICCPVGPYYSAGLLKPISLLADPSYIRAWPGGYGEFKLGGNYGPTLYNQREASEKYNCSQTLWLFNDEITEVGSMNFFSVIRNDQGKSELVTAPLNGLVLPGITRDSILTLVREWEDTEASERTMTMAEYVKLNKEGRVLEAFGAGTGCLVSPVSEIVYKGEKILLPDNGFPFATRILNALEDIQYGRKAHQWNSYIIKKNHA